MQTHTRRTTHKQIARFSPPSGSTARTATPVAQEAELELNDEALPNAAKDLACLRAERYREVDSEDLRDDDIRQAEAEIVATFKHEDTA